MFDINKWRDDSRAAVEANCTVENTLLESEEIYKCTCDVSAVNTSTSSSSSVVKENECQCKTQGKSSFFNYK